MRPNIAEKYFGADGRPTVTGQKLLQDAFDRIEALEAKLSAISAVGAPSGGATVDSEARSAITSVINAAG